MNEAGNDTMSPASGGTPPSQLTGLSLPVNEPKKHYLKKVFWRTRGEIHRTHQSVLWANSKVSARAREARAAKSNARASIGAFF
jgi:hypothetical protein